LLGREEEEPRPCTFRKMTEKGASGGFGGGKKQKGRYAGGVSESPPRTRRKRPSREVSDLGEKKNGKRANQLRESGQKKYYTNTRVCEKVDNEKSGPLDIHRVV